MSTDAIGLITADHRDIESLFQQIIEHPENRPALFAEVCAKFLAHSVSEEERVYPEISRLAPEHREEVEHGAEEHHKAEELLFELQKVDPDSAEFEQGLQQLIAAVEEHVQEEESKVLPLLSKVAPKETLMELGRSFSVGKAEVLQNPSAVTPAKIKSLGKEKGRTAKGKDTGRSKTTGKAKAGQEMSKEELYEKAKEADIPGRSQMSKDELAKAVQKSHH